MMLTLQMYEPDCGKNAEERASCINSSIETKVLMQTFTPFLLIIMVVEQMKMA